MRFRHFLLPLLLAFLPAMPGAAFPAGSIETLGTGGQSAAGSIVTSEPGTDATDIEAAEPVQSVLDILAADPRFSLFSTLVDMAGPPDIFTGGGPMTVFAPTDSILGPAFEAFMAGAEGDAYEARLRKLVLAHVLDAQFTPDDMVANITSTRRQRENLATVSRDNITLMIVEGRVRVYDESAQVVPFSLAGEARDGIVYALEGAMLRPR